MQFRLVYEDVQDGVAVIKGSTENIPTNDDDILCERADLEDKGLVYETRDENDALVIMASEDHLPGGLDDFQVYPIDPIVEETPDPDPVDPVDPVDPTPDPEPVNPTPEPEPDDEGGDTGETETPKVEE